LTVLDEPPDEPYERPPDERFLARASAGANTVTAIATTKPKDTAFTIRMFCDANIIPPQFEFTTNEELNNVLTPFTIIASGDRSQQSHCFLIQYALF
jgi:hypothetical protein